MKRLEHDVERLQVLAETRNKDQFVWNLGVLIKYCGKLLFDHYETNSIGRRMESRMAKMEQNLSVT